jgi:hypothetical protein
MKENSKTRIQKHLFFKLFSRFGIFKPRFLPNYFRIIGIVIIGLAVVVRIFFPSFHFQNDSSRIINTSILILGLLFVAISKDKVEDEMVELLRLKTMAYAFSFGVIYVVISPILYLISGLPVKDFEAQHLIFIVLTNYIIIYFFSLKDR